MSRRFASMILAMMLTGIALADEPAAESTRTLSCSAAFPSVAVACFIEQPVATFGSVELAVGIDAAAYLTNADKSAVGVYAIIAVYEPTWNAWAEIALPDIAPLLGRPDPLRVGFTMRF